MQDDLTFIKKYINDYQYYKLQVEKLLKFENLDILEEIIQNPNCTKEILLKLYNYDSLKEIVQKRLKTLK